MPEVKAMFLKESREVISDGAFQSRFKKSKQTYLQKREEALSGFSDIQTARKRAAFIRWKAIENLDKYLIEFEANVIKNKGKVLWAQDVEQAHEEIESVLSKNNELPVVNNGGLAAEEIRLFEWLEKSKKLVLKAGAAKQEQRQLADTFSAQSFPENINETETLEKSTYSAVQISEATFICADTGSVVIQGNNKDIFNQCTSKVQIVLAFIDSILPSVSDVGLMLPLTSAFRDGEGNFPFFSIVRPYSKANENDRTEDFYVLIIDNGRSNLLARENQRQALHCIKCRACEYVCPTYQTIGNKPYKHTLTGPIASVALPYIENFEQYHFLSFSSTMYDAYKSECPVNIDFKKGIMHNRAEAVRRKLNTSGDKWFYYIWKKTMLKRDFIKVKGINPRKKMIETLFLNSQNNFRVLPEAVPKTFNEQWRERTGQK